MKSSHLHDMWSTPDNGRLVSKQFSLRLPVHIAAKIAALGELYPQKNRTQIIADLLTLALDDLERNLPYSMHEAPKHIQDEENEISHHLGYEVETVYELGGARAQFRYAANKYYFEYERELGNEKPTALYSKLHGSKEYLENLTK